MESHSSTICSASQSMKISLCITTYNSVMRLQQVFLHLLKLAEFPTEVLICDDGSGQATRDLVDWFRGRVPVPVHHLWEPDCGWRPSRARNNGIHHSSGDYLVFLDGDCVPHPLFITDHRRLASAGSMVLGDRAHVREAALSHFSGAPCDLMKALLAGRIHKRSSAVRLFFERPRVLRFEGLSARQLAHVAIGCNFSAWRSDLVGVNGFNEEITGWGLEDVELIARIMATGVKALKVKRRAVVYHLDHGERAYDAEAVLVPVERVFRDALTVTPSGLDRLRKSPSERKSQCL